MRDQLQVLSVVLPAAECAGLFANPQVELLVMAAAPGMDRERRRPWWAARDVKAIGRYAMRSLDRYVDLPISELMAPLGVTDE
ncbi:hypothetical protein HNP40_002884 [Mycobacteroides chelonae]|nr:hypothetical protein [Mycobacteroides chelonae]